jgi:hypothetical protein
MNIFLLAQRSASEMQPWWNRVLDSGEALKGLVAVTAIVAGLIWLLTTAIIRHRERMAMIEQGMNPNQTTSEETQAKRR